MTEGSCLCRKAAVLANLSTRTRGIVLDCRNPCKVALSMVPLLDASDS